MFLPLLANKVNSFLWCWVVVHCFLNLIFLQNTHENFLRLLWLFTTWSFNFSNSFKFFEQKMQICSKDFSWTVFMWLSIFFESLKALSQKSHSLMSFFSCSLFCSNGFCSTGSKANGSSTRFSVHSWKCKNI